MHNRLPMWKKNTHLILHPYCYISNLDYTPVARKFLIPPLSTALPPFTANNNAEMINNIINPAMIIAAGCRNNTIGSDSSILPCLAGLLI